MPDFFEKEISLFAEVILPLSLPKNYTYGIPKELEEQSAPGKRVEIQFGQRKIYAGLIKRLHSIAPKEYKIKPILSVIDAQPIVSQMQMKFWEWMAGYYLCSEGDVMNAALPAGFKLESETQLKIHPDFNDDFTKLNDKEYVVAEALQIQKELTISEISKMLRRRNVYPVIDSLIKKNVAIVKEQLIERYKPKYETWIRINPQFATDAILKKLFDELEKKAKKQLEVLMTYIHTCNQNGKGYQDILREELLDKAGSDATPLQSLVKKGILIAEKKETGRIRNNSFGNEIAGFQLTLPQQSACDQIRNTFKEKPVALLQGITGSGKTLLYIQLMREAVQQGKQVLYLLPEIALTAQMIERLQAHFGNRIGIYHSRFNQQERVEIWNKLLHKEYDIVLGARSALFLPFENPGLIIVDEEHDPSYKQNDPAPRYHGRDAAIYLASLFNAKTLLGSATPSLESFHNVKLNKFGYAQLTERYGDASLPEIILVDTKEAQRKKLMHSHFTSLLLDEIKSSLARKEQVILFQNRRGYAPHLECPICNWTAMCPNCDVFLTYHKFQNELRCHYCNHRKNNFKQCPACGSAKLLITGFGTEKIEDELKIFFPNTTISRLDLDTAKTRTGYQKIIRDFERAKVQILVGTQMVTKGLDFENVSLVGIMNADQLMSHGDFRTAERGFQLMSQVSGRAGRKSTAGKVIIQTSQPASYLLQFVLSHNYSSYYEEEMKHRNKFFYPPYSRLICLTFKHKEAKKVWEAARSVGSSLQKEFGKNLLGPAEPPVSRIKNLYLVQLLLKLQPSGKLIMHAKHRIQDAIQKLTETPALRSVHIITDVDPY